MILERISIPECLNELNNKYKNLDKNIVLLENSLSDYRTELKQLREKYNVKTIEDDIKTHATLREEIRKDMLKIKYKYVAELVFATLNTEIIAYPYARASSFATKTKNRARFFKWLADTYGIVYKQSCNFIRFETFYGDYIATDEDIDIVIGDTSVKIYAEYYFRGELDDEVEFTVPINTLNKVETIASEIEQFLDMLTKEKEEAERSEAIEAEKREYAQFLRLKEKFGSKE